MNNTYNDQIQKLSLMELMMEWKHINDSIKDHSTSLQTLNDKERLIEELIKEKDDALKKIYQDKLIDELLKDNEAINFPVNLPNPNKPKVSVENTTPEIKSVITDTNGREIDLDTEIKNISFVPIDYPSARMINTRIINTLAKENIVFLDQLVELDKASLLRMSGISRITISHIEHFLMVNKLKLKD